MRMKKFFLVAAMAFFALGANAQWFVGGDVSIWSTKYDSNSLFSDQKRELEWNVSPYVGYNLSDRWAILADLSIGQTLNNGGYEGSHSLALKIGPFVRYTYASIGMVDFFLTGGFQYGLDRNYGKSIVDQSYNLFWVGIEPGVKLNLADRFALVAHIGALGYSYEEGYMSDFGFNLSARTLSLGAELRF